MPFFMFLCFMQSMNVPKGQVDTVFSYFFSFLKSQTCLSEIKTINDFAEVQHLEHVFGIYFF